MATDMVKERDTDSGRFTKAVSDDAILSYLAEQNGAGTAAVAARFDYEQPSAYRRLRDLEAAGRVTSRRVGGSLLWTVDD